MVKDAIASGVDGYDADVRKAVQKAAHGLRLSREAAMSIAGKAVSIYLNHFAIIICFSINFLFFSKFAFVYTRYEEFSSTS